MLPVRDSVPRRGFPIATVTIIALAMAVFLYELSLTPLEVTVLFHELGFVPARFFDNPAWGPLLTSMFLHGGWAHLLANLWTLWIFGDNVEDEMGAAPFLGFFVVTGIAGSFAQGIADPSSTVPMVGASGAISGVLAAYLFLFPRARLVVAIPIVIIPLFFEMPAIGFLLVWLATQIVGSSLGDLGAGGGIAWWAHLGGFAAGALLHPLFLAPLRATGPGSIRNDEPLSWRSR